jgi:hypothetical protein
VRSRQVVAIFTMLVLASPLWAQMGILGTRTPGMSGVWNPVVGSGAAYEMTNRDGKKSQLEITIVGKEEVNGKTSYWMEMAMSNARGGADTYLKYLISPTDKGLAPMRMIMQLPGEDPTDVDMNLVGGSRVKQSIPTDIRDKSELVGTETVTVPAGTFSCEHYKMKDSSSDAWVSDKVAPWGLVKTQGKDSSIVLAKVITDAKDHITGTPKKFDPMQIMRDRMRNRGQ